MDRRKRGGMAAALEVVLAAHTGVSPRKQRDYSYLKPYQFKPGHAPVPRADGTVGRPVGLKDAATIYLESLPLKARQWVKSTDAKILSEARQLVAKSTPELSLPSDRGAALTDAERPPTLVFVIQTSDGKSHIPINLHAEPAAVNDA